MQRFGGIRKLLSGWFKPKRDKIPDVRSVKVTPVEEEDVSISPLEHHDVAVDHVDMSKDSYDASKDENKVISAHGVGESKLDEDPLGVNDPPKYPDAPELGSEKQIEFFGTMVSEKYEDPMKWIHESDKSADIYFKNMKRLDLSTIEFVAFPDNQYMREVHPKKQVCLHHTVSPVGVQGDLSWWLQTSDRVATALIIHHNGKPYQCFSSKFWAHHLGIKWSVFQKYNFPDFRTRNAYLNEISIGIEIDSLGPLVEEKNQWYWAKWDKELKKHVPNYRVPVDEDKVQFYPNGFRGFEAFEKYTDEQIITTGGTLLLWHDRYNIPLDYRPDMWDVSRAALNGDPGIWSHNSYRPDKSDVHPQPELIKMLKQLKRYA